MQIMRFPLSLKQYPSEGRWLPTTLHHSEFVQRHSGQIYPSEKHGWDLDLNDLPLTEYPGPCEMRQGKEVKTSAGNRLLGSEAQSSMPWRTKPGVSHEYRIRRSLQPSSSLSFGMKAWICSAAETVINPYNYRSCILSPMFWGYFLFLASEIQSMMESWQTVLCVIKGVIWSLY